MPFIGQQPITGAYSVLDDITTSATATTDALPDIRTKTRVAAGRMVFQKGGAASGS